MALAAEVLAHKRVPQFVQNLGTANHRRQNQERIESKPHAEGRELGCEVVPVCGERDRGGDAKQARN